MYILNIYINIIYIYIYINILYIMYNIYHIERGVLQLHIRSMDK